MTMWRLFLDANVLFTAAHRPQGKAGFLFAEVAAGSPHWQLVSSVYAVEEARRNIASKYPQAAPELLRLTRQLKLADQPATVRIALALPEKDLPIWAAALACRATHLLTGDLKDFGRFMNRPEQTAGVMIQTVSEFLAGL